MHAAAPSLETRANRARALISARGLSKIYATASDEVTALKNLDFEIYDGEFVSVVGQSGCGKSTLLKMLAGLLPYTAGSVALNGRALRGPSREAANGPAIVIGTDCPALAPEHLRTAALALAQRARPARPCRHLRHRRRPLRRRHPPALHRAGPARLAGLLRRVRRRPRHRGGQGPARDG